MHEFSICSELVNVVLEEVEKRDAQKKEVIRVFVRVGALRRIVPEYFREAYKVICKGTPAEGSEMVIEVAPPSALCGDCGWEGEISADDFACRRCGSYNVRVEGGKDISLERIQLSEVIDEDRD
mgnify:CR=1 FL=1